MCFANGVENRLPFLDPELISFGQSIPIGFRIGNGLEEKLILKKAFAEEVPIEVLNRFKSPYRAPDAKAFLHGSGRDLLESETNKNSNEATGFLYEDFCIRLKKKFLESNGRISERESQAILFLMSTCILNRLFNEQICKVDCTRVESLLKVDAFENPDLPACNMPAN